MATSTHASAAVTIASPLEVLTIELELAGTALVAVPMPDWPPNAALIVMGDSVVLVSVPMVLHGLYDTLLKKDYHVLALLTALASFIWLAWQIESARRYLYTLYVKLERLRQEAAAFAVRSYAGPALPPEEQANLRRLHLQIQAITGAE